MLQSNISLHETCIRSSLQFLGNFIHTNVTLQHQHQQRCWSKILSNSNKLSLIETPMQMQHNAAYAMFLICLRASTYDNTVLQSLQFTSILRVVFDHGWKEGFGRNLKSLSSLLFVPLLGHLNLWKGHLKPWTPNFLFSKVQRKIRHTSPNLEVLDLNWYRKERNINIDIEYWQYYFELKNLMSTQTVL